MLFHLSIDADEPRRVAAVIAELWGGTALPFPPVLEGSWVAMAGDERATLVEVYPRGAEMHEAPGADDAGAVIGANSARSATHFAIATALDEADVLAIAAREGWPAKLCTRGGLFGVVELWVEGTRMVEVLTPAMQADYQRAMSVANWRAMLASPPPASLAA